MYRTIHKALTGTVGMALFMLAAFEPAPAAQMGAATETALSLAFFAASALMLKTYLKPNKQYRKDDRQR